MLKNIENTIEILRLRSTAAQDDELRISGFKDDELRISGFKDDELRISGSSDKLRAFSSLRMTNW